MSDGSKINVKIGGFGRLLTEGNLFKDIYHNAGKCEGNRCYLCHFFSTNSTTGSQAGFIGITANYPATVIPINMEEFGGEIHCNSFPVVACT